MQPDQSQANSNPDLPQQTDTSAIQPPNVGQPGGSTKIIQPLSSDLSTNTEPTVNTTPAVMQLEPPGINTPLPDNNTQQLPSSPSTIYPEPQTGYVSSPSSPISQVSIEKGEKQGKKRKRLIVLLVCLVAVLLLGASGFYYWYSQQDHSVYAKLTTENYNKDGISFSFQYSSIMSVSTKALAANKDTKAAYEYESGTTKLGIIMGAIPFSSILKQFNITPTQELTQLKTGQGNFANSIKTANPTVFNTDYGNCNWITTNSGQKDLICTHQESSDGGNTVIIVIGADNNYQYDLTLGITNNIYSAYQKVWQKIEKSFNY